MVCCTMNFYHSDKMLKASFEKIERGNAEETPYQMAGKMVAASRQCSFPHVDCCRNICLRKEHFSFPAASPFPVFHTTSFLSLPQDQNGPQRTIYYTGYSHKLEPRYVTVHRCCEGCFPIDEHGCPHKECLTELTEVCEDTRMQHCSCDERLPEPPYCPFPGKTDLTLK
ncbi:uncharacterized protein TNCT_225951 [Trichonephila clavata]|uniref:Uncharacterized protein n=1 Tax=Trichonephila clavata TaxID=2740835 RepID=A0A8X6HZH6_TRICU|nr:uncharacterized protein TNCT_225951 [Trichonephila clavata]